MKEISAGGVVFRMLEEGPEIQLIQDRYGKISLPKGKMEQGETIEQTALREIVEETGITGKIVAPLEVIRYQYTNSNGDNVHKEVHYYLVESQSGTLQPQLEEIRGVEWLSPHDAWRKQRQSGYDNNHSILAAAYRELGLPTEGL